MIRVGRIGVTNRLPSFRTPATRSILTVKPTGSSGLIKHVGKNPRMDRGSEAEATGEPPVARALSGASGSQDGLKVTSYQPGCFEAQSDL